ncbi:MAG: putative dehydrogenase [Rhodothermales bacterium]|jgi:predicted dehydrogenase
MGLRWGFVGLGRIAEAFATDLKLVAGSVIQAVGSRSGVRSTEFGAKVGSLRAYDSYIGVFTDPDVDIVYIASTHDSHAELAIQALDHGKHVLCEKPLAVNRRQAEAMVAASRRNHRFLMEAFWTRFNPAFSEVLSRCRAGDLGEIRYVSGDFAFRVDPSPGGRLFDLATAGGSLLDVGVYPLFLAYSVLGIPDEVTARMIRHPSGVDWQLAMILSYPSAQAVLYSGFASRSSLVATISGRDGRFGLGPVWHECDEYRHLPEGSPDEEQISRPRTGRGFVHEIQECQACIADGRIESDSWSHTDSLALLAMADAVRDVVGLRYPFETGDL